MKRAAVIYATKHGAAEQYAKWIAEATGADLFDQKKTKPRDVKDYDIIVFGGGIYSGGIKGIDFLRKHVHREFKGKTVICFGVGISVDLAPANIDQANEINFTKKLEHVPCYYLPGAYKPSEVSGLDKRLMAITRKMVVQGNQSDASRKLLGYIDDGCNLVDKKRVRPIVSEIRRMMKDDTAELRPVADVEAEVSESAEEE